ncbi:TIR-like PF08937 domain protein [Leptospira kirschneri str. JB]|uniref:TIR domain-containing protein n=1 Tax=Leptospira kirschneri TaxID=29507 RepID=UPI0002BECA4D|nr:TIR domain-containing protein [Leptospira kirschneri]EMJ93026.1 TIR-like PF08937 domain protein [Leptospira kirschneri str. JB]
MARKVFYSFHYSMDSWRASQIRNIGAVEGNKPASDNDWEELKKGGDSAIAKWIDSQLDGRSCTIVLIGKDTAERKWIKYEIEKSWDLGKGLVGIYIHNLKNSEGNKSSKGRNPFETSPLDNGKKKLSDYVKTIDPPYSTSTDVYDHIKNNLSKWIEDAIAIRNNYGK